MRQVCFVERLRRSKDFGNCYAATESAIGLCKQLFYSEWKIYEYFCRLNTNIRLSL